MDELPLLRAQPAPQIPHLIGQCQQVSLELPDRCGLLQETRAELTAPGNVTRLDSRRVTARHESEQ